MTDLNRRKWLQGALVSAGSFSLFSKTARAFLDSCGLTPEQTEGPFYPIHDQADKDNDLTFIRGGLEMAKGEVIEVKGIVTDENCQPVSGALVEIWQACASGKYNHPGDPNPAPLDPHFQYWGRDITNSAGEYGFKTIKPGAYPATSTWMRPPHIHFKVHRRGFEELTGQMYFRGESLNNADRILQGLSLEEQEKVIIKFEQLADEHGLPVAGIKVGHFNISLRRL